MLARVKLDYMSQNKYQMFYLMMIETNKPNIG